MILKYVFGQKEQSDQGLHCLPFRLHYLDKFLYGKSTLFMFKEISTFEPAHEITVLIT